MKSFIKLYSIDQLTGAAHARAMMHSRNIEAEVRYNTLYFVDGTPYPVIITNPTGGLHWVHRLMVCTYDDLPTQTKRYVREAPWTHVTEEFLLTNKPWYTIDGIAVDYAHVDFIEPPRNIGWQELKPLYQDKTDREQLREILYDWSSNFAQNIDPVITDFPQEYAENMKRMNENCDRLLEELRRHPHDQI